MLRVSLANEGGKLTLKLEGRLVEPWASELRDAALRTIPGHKLVVVDIRDMVFADGAGEEVLKWLHELGAKFIAGTAFSGYLCERLGIPECLPDLTAARHAPSSGKKDRRPTCKKTGDKK
jgi:hypothetical protein